MVPCGGLKAHGGKGDSALGSGWKETNLSSEDSSQPSLHSSPGNDGGEPIIAPHAGSPTFLPSIHLLPMMSPFLLHLKVQPAEWPVASLGAEWTPSPQAAGEMPM